MPTKKRTILALACALALLVGCIPISINPPYKDTDLVFDPRLVGAWAEEGTKLENWAVKQGSNKSYDVTVTEEHGEKGEFEGHLFKLKDYLFLELKPSAVHFDQEQSDAIKWALVAGHWIFRVQQLDSELKLSAPDDSWIYKYLSKNPNALAHFTEGGFDPGDHSVIVTASTQDLQRFVLAHIGEKELFGRPAVYVRRPAGNH